jgi:hypothetical protein
MKVSDIQIDDLLRKYRLRKYSLQLSDKRFSCYGIAQVQETIAALLELKDLRKAAVIPVKGTVR